MATRGAQKKANAVDEKKLQQAVESWLKKHRAAVQDKKLQSVVDDFVKSHRKDISDRGMKIIRRVISEGRTKRAPMTASRTTTPASSSEKPMKASRSGPKTSSEKPIRAENRTGAKSGTRGPQKPAPKGTLKSVTDATARTGSRVGALSKAATGLGALAYSEKLGGGKDTMEGKESRRNEFVDKYKRGRGDGAAEVKARKAEAERKAKERAKKAATTSPKESGSYKIKKGDTLSEIAQRKGTTVKALMEKNPQIKDKDKIYAGRSLKLNKGGVVKANCGASMKPTQKSSKGIK